MKRGVVLAALLLVAVTAAAPASAKKPAPYRNPTAGSALVYQIRGMHRANVRRAVVYRTVDGSALGMDVYRPRTARTAPLPAVLIGTPLGRRTGQPLGWAQLIAASGVAAVAFDIRSDNNQSTPFAPASDVAGALEYLRAHGGELGIDPARLCTLGFSIGTAPWHLWAALRGPDPSVRCNAVYYGALDFQSGWFQLDRSLVGEFSALTYLRRDGARVAPMLIAKAGRDQFPVLNETIDRFVAEGQRVGADVRLLTHPNAPHAFDVRFPGPRSRTIIRATLAFFRVQLAPARQLSARRLRPLPMRDPCVRGTLRQRIVRFSAADHVRLIGVRLGSGPRGLVLGHMGGQDLCAWLPYARRFEAAGFNVLIFDFRRHGSSGYPLALRKLNRFDLDMRAAVGALRRRGAQSVVIAGGSLGAIASVWAAPAIAPPVNGVVSLSAPDFFQNVDLAVVAHRLTVPVLFMAAADDSDGIFVDAARKLYDAAAAADKRLVTFSEGGHGINMFRGEGAAGRWAPFEQFVREHSAAPSGGAVARAQ